MAYTDLKGGGGGGGLCRGILAGRYNRHALSVNTSECTGGAVCKGATPSVEQPGGRGFKICTSSKGSIIQLNHDQLGSGY